MADGRPGTCGSGRDDADTPEPAATSARRGEAGGAAPAPAPAPASFLAPMLAELHRQPPPPGRGRWVLERKFDGLRAVAVRNGDKVELWSRNRQSFATRFPYVVAALRELPAEDFTLDGEIVAYDGERTSFELLQRPGSRGRPVFEVFDVVHLLGEDTTALPLEDRRRLVAELLGGDREGVLRAVEELDGEAAELLSQACREGWEGLVAKRPGSPYRSGRSRDWLKLKCDSRQELVVGGYTEPRGSRRHLGALLVGYYDGEQRLRFAGKVGTGFDESTLKQLGALLVPREIAEAPFADLPPAMRRGAHFVPPEVVVSIAFAEWTAGGRLRQPRYQGLRPDKSAAEVVREMPVRAGAGDAISAHECRRSRGRPGRQ